MGLLRNALQSFRASEPRFHEWIFLACFGLLALLICGGWLYWWAVDYRLSNVVAECEAENNKRIVATFNQVSKPESGWVYLLNGQLVCDPSVLRTKSQPSPVDIEGRVLSAYQAKYSFIHHGGTLRFIAYLGFGLALLGILPAIAYFTVRGLRKIFNATGND